MNVNKYKILAVAGLFLCSVRIAATPSLSSEGLKKLPTVTFPKKKAGGTDKTTDQDAKKNKTPELTWYNDLDTALAKASIEFRPLLIEFRSPNCPWCEKLDKEVFSSPELAPFLSEMILVKIDITKDTRTPAFYQIVSVPVTSFCSADGRELIRLNGYVDRKTMLETVKAVLNNKITAKKVSTLNVLIKQLKDREVPDKTWPEIMLALGKYPDSRGETMNLIRNYSPFPKKQFVRMLTDKRLAVRLGALEVLEEFTGDDFEFDPWAPPGSMRTSQTLQKWKKWAEIKDNTSGKKRFSALTEERCAVLLSQAICGDSTRELRAVRLLRNGGRTSIKAIEKFLTEHPGMSEGKLNRLKELEYSLLIPALAGRDPVMLAHRLIFGKLDSRIQAIMELKKSSHSVFPILADMLRDKESMIREMAIETFISVGGKKALPFLSKHLENEKDKDVIFAVLRGIEDIKDKKAGVIYKKYLDYPDEDIVIAALNGLAATKTGITAGRMKKYLSDNRWRVRVAALNVVAKLHQKKLFPAVEKMLNDKDDFVRFKAVQTLSFINKGKAPKVLEKAFLNDDSLKGAVIAAYGSMDRRIPGSFIRGLKGKSDSVLLSVIQGMDECGKKALPLAVYLAGSKVEDVRVPAVRFLAEHGITKTPSRYNALLAAKLLKGDEKEKLAVLHNFSPPAKVERSFGSTGELENLLIEIEESKSDSKEGGEGTKSGAGVSEEISDLFDAFDADKAKKKKTAKPAEQNKKVNLPEKKNTPDKEDILDLFETFEKVKEPEKAASAKKKKKTKKPRPAAASAEKKSADDANVKKATLEELKKAITELFRTTGNSEVKFYAASIMTFYGESEGLPYLKKNFARQTVEIRRGILNILEDSTKKGAVEIALEALSDDDDNVRREAASIILKTKKGSYITKLLEKMEGKKAAFNPYDISSYELRNGLQTLSAKKAARAWAVKILKSQDARDVLKSFALFIVDKTWSIRDEKLVAGYLGSQNKWLRRAAYHALANNKSPSGTFAQNISKLLKDQDYEVRIVLPRVVQFRGRRSYRNNWVHFYDDKHFFEDYSFRYVSSSSAPRISVTEEKALRKLLKDEDPKVRMEASFALLTARKAIDLKDFVSLLKTFPDQNAVAGRVKDYLSSNYKVLGPGFSILLTFLAREDMSNSTVKEIFKHFNIAEEKAGDFDFIIRTGASGKAEASFVDAAETGKQKPDKSAAENMRLVYFSKKGCQDCARVKKELKKLRDIFPGILIETHDIGKIDSMRLNEAYCEKFGVPEKLRLVAPSVFSGKGYLIKEDVNMPKLIPLAAESAEIPLADWYVLNKKELNVSEKRIKERYRRTNIWIVMLAGLLDGINPCAFATIIFFLSYLQITRKNPNEIIAVGISFIIAVFVSYMAFGLGLNEIIGKFYIFDLFRLWFNRIMAMMIFTIMVMSFYDGVQCLRGKMESMALQLPAFLKERIRAAIRKGSKSRNFVIAAFVVGCIVSFLELACTGQVYLPTLGYMWQTGADRSGALFYLLIYNLMFILPLIIIFLAAFFGLKSDKLTDIFRKHAALVKFSTSLLFLALLAVLLRTSQIF